MSVSDITITNFIGRIVSAVALVALAPVFVTLGVTILLETGLPIFFSQRRVGRNGTMFNLFKFRTMRTGQSGPAITASGDHRVTRSGRFMRKYKLDELPQLWNVVRGDMSVVGPRPEVPEFVDYSQLIWRTVLGVRPGITDPASIKYLNEESILASAPNSIHYYREVLLPAKLSVNEAYLRKRTCWQDFKVILRTISCIAFPD